jgi:toxin HigB-1
LGGSGRVTWEFKLWSAPAAIRRILDLIEQAASVEQLDIPGMHLHPLKFERKGEWAMTVSGNWRITFRFVGEDATDLNLEDYH